MHRNVPVTKQAPSKPRHLICQHKAGRERPTGARQGSEPHCSQHFLLRRLRNPNGGEGRVLAATAVWLFATPMNRSPPGSSVHGILQARTLEWAAVPFSRRPSQPRNWTRICCIAGRFFTGWATTAGEGFNYTKTVSEGKKAGHAIKSLKRLADALPSAPPNHSARIKSRSGPSLTVLQKQEKGSLYLVGVAPLGLLSSRSSPGKGRGRERRFRQTPRGFPHAQPSACQVTIKTHKRGDLEQLQKLYKG